MNCQTVQEQLSAYLSGDLSSVETTQLESHLKGCEACQAEKRDLEDWLSQLKMLPTQSPSQGTWDTLLQKIEQEELHHPQQTAVEALPEQKSKWQTLQMGWLRWFYGFGAGVAASVLVLWFASPQPKERIHKHTPTHRTFKKKRVDTRPPKHVERTSPKHAKKKQMQKAFQALDKASQQYRKTLDYLSQIAKKKFPKSTPQGQILQQTLLALDQAILKCRQMIRQNPNDLETRKVLLAVYQRKVDLLRDVVLETL